MADAPTTVTIDARRLRREISYLAEMVEQIMDNPDIEASRRGSKIQAAIDETFANCLGFNS